MMNIFERFALLAIAFITGCSSPADKSRKSFAHYADFAAKIAKCDAIRLFEGLPHPHYDRDLLAGELESKETIEIGGFPFYSAPILLAADDAKRLKDLYLDSNSFAPFGGAKDCGGYHPDYCIEWSDGNLRVYVQICFGCYEMKTIVNGAELHCDIRNARDEFSSILLKYHKQRPLSAEGTMGRRIRVPDQAKQP